MGRKEMKGESDGDKEARRKDRHNEELTDP